MVNKNRDERSEIRFLLHNLDSLDEDIKNILIAIENLQKADRIEMQITSFLSDMPTAQNANNDGSQLEKVAIKNVETISRLQRELKQKTIKSYAIKKIITYLIGYEREIIEKKYIIKQQGRKPPSYKEISSDLNLAEEYVKEIEAKIINKIQKEIKNYIES